MHFALYLGSFEKSDDPKLIFGVRLPMMASRTKLYTHPPLQLARFALQSPVMQTGLRKS